MGNTGLNSDGHSLGGSAHVSPSKRRRNMRGTGQQIVLVLAQPLNSSEVFLSQFPAAVLGEPCDEVPHSRVQGATTLTWSGAWDRRLLSLRWGPIFLKGTLRWYW